MKLPNLNLFSRTFVSLVISPKQLKAIKINPKTNKVIKFAQINVPPGIIVNYRVKDKETLVKLIRELWEKNKFGEKYVGVVVPEFSTYTKSLALPNLTDTEIREAITHKMQEYLPVPVGEVVFDWKMVKRSKQEVEVLVVAILRNVLLSYVDAIAEAGLSPLVVETPSLSIQRIIDGEEGGKMIIYVSSSEAILVITAGSEIVASSVVTTGKFDNVVSTARQMLTHYSSVSIEKVMISGVGLTQDLVQFLNYNLGRPVQFADIRVGGMAPAQVQDFLIGVSMQHKNAAAPESELTVNLLPPAWAEYYKKLSLGIREWSLTLIASIIIWATFLSVMIVFMFLNLEKQNLQNGAGEAIANELNSAVSEVRGANSLAEEIIDFNENIVYPQEVINLIISARPEGVSLSGYRINFETGEIFISGNAVVRENLLSFRDSLKEREEFSDISLPLNVLVQENDINFELRMFYKDFVKETKSGPVKLQI